MMDWNDGWGWGAWLAMSLMMVGFWGLIAFVVVAIVRGTSHAPSGGGPVTDESADRALRILDERFARGEIDADEYARRRDQLQHR